MKIIIHRGTQEIGGTCVEVISSNNRIIIDMGIPLVDKDGKSFNMDQYKSFHGKELVYEKVLPDIKGLYKWDEGKDKVDGILISHPHLDHYGLFSYINTDIKYYIGEAAKKLIDLTCIFTPLKGSISNYEAIRSGRPFNIGDFKITPYLMDHSAFDSYCFLIEAEGKRILYTGDFRNHGRKKKAFDYFISKISNPIDVVLIEGTMLGRGEEEVKTEEEIENEGVEIVKGTKKAVLVLQSSQNIDRIVTMYRIAKRSGKIFVIDFYTANILSALNTKSIPHPSKDFGDIKVYYPWRLSNMIVQKGYGDLLYKYKAYKITKEEINQNIGSIMMLMRSSMINDLEKIRDIEHSTLIYSLWSGYLKDPSMKKLLKFKDDKKMKLVQLHTSGHATKETLKLLIDNISPKVLIPIHTFNPKDFIYLHSNIKLLKDGECFTI